MFTHDDGDHFSAKSVNENYIGNTIFCPPSIAYKLLAGGIVYPEKLVVFSPPERDKPQEYSVNDTVIKAYNTEHFVNWHPAHLSYLIEFRGKRIYITGDSHPDNSLPDIYNNFDCLVYSLVMEDVVKDRISKEEGAVFHLAELLDIRNRYKPGVIICNHLIDCSWTVNPHHMNDCLKFHNIEGIIVPTDSAPYIIKVHGY